MGITTAEDVPPRITPSKIEGNSSSSSIANPMAPTMSAVKTKHSVASRPVVPSDLPSVVIFSEVPLSNRITTNAIVAMSEPILPKSSGVTMPRMGPIKIPTSISTSTSGILVLRNCNDKKCAKNTIRPMTNMVVDIAFPLTSGGRLYMPNFSEIPLHCARFFRCYNRTLPSGVHSSTIRNMTLGGTI